MTDNKFLNKTKIINLYNQDFDFVRIILDTETSFKTQFGFNVRVLLLIYYKDKTIVHCKKFGDSTYTLKTLPKYQYVQMDVTKEQQENDKGKYYPTSFVEPVDEIDITYLKLREMKRQSKQKETVSQYEQQNLKIVD
ncbi:Hypothetical_protein [Hexamita inflata]|uniref:Hypothetical_protein n=1 Tax=Hexamita inflata TaxID=28002 RepID=A0AA86RTZ3_9EUKA|nr:Hypothetical protein HINF_LOCUS60145 [Hexamita inflata]